MKLPWYAACLVSAFAGIAFICLGEGYSATLWVTLSTFFLMQATATIYRRTENYTWSIFDENEMKLTSSGGTIDIESVRKVITILVPYYREKGARRIIVSCDMNIIFDAMITDGAISEVLTDITEQYA